MERIKFPQHNKTDNITAINPQLKILTDSYKLHLQIHNPKNISFPNKIQKVESRSTIYSGGIFY